MCCGGRMCMLCTCLILVVIVIGLSFGFGVFKNGFHKLKDHLDVCDPNAIGSLCGGGGGGGGRASRPFLGFPAPPPGSF
uniref:Transmembrane protein n=1 Tax=Salix viminalis TaxID=40686 RepID=A0A6N2KY51_SALVM